MKNNNQVNSNNSQQRKKKQEIHASHGREPKLMRLIPAKNPRRYQNFKTKFFKKKGFSK